MQRLSVQNSHAPSGYWMLPTYFILHGGLMCQQILAPCICIPPSKLHLHFYELEAHFFFPSLLYHICFSTSYVWKNSSTFLLVSLFSGLYFYLLLFHQPPAKLQHTVIMISHRPDCFLLYYELENQGKCACHLFIVEMNRKDE